MANLNNLLKLSNKLIAVTNSFTRILPDGQIIELAFSINDESLNANLSLNWLGLQVKVTVKNEYCFSDVLEELQVEIVEQLEDEIAKLVSARDKYYDSPRTHSDPDKYPRVQEGSINKIAQLEMFKSSVERILK